MYLIDADVFIEEWIKYGNSDFIFDFPLAIVREIIANTPTVDAEPVKHGKWIEKSSKTKCCSVCGYYVSKSYSFKRCPDCGAKMDGE